LLLDKGYPPNASLALVGDHFQLRARQRTALERWACPARLAKERRARRLGAAACRGKYLLVDGFNQIITVEAALSGGILLRADDGALRDLAGIHGSYRQVQETAEALRLLADTIGGIRPARVTVFLDAPVSNSGRLKQALLSEFAARDAAWRVELSHNPDRDLVAEPGGVAVSSDSWVLDHGDQWFDLAGAVVTRHITTAQVLDLRNTSRQATRGT
jgi:hypothetical protein